MPPIVPCGHPRTDQEAAGWISGRAGLRADYSDRRKHTTLGERATSMSHTVAGAPKVGQHERQRSLGGANFSSSPVHEEAAHFTRRFANL
jgi:hypothetical protein